MASMNKAIIIGNLGKDPELKYTQNQTAVCNFSVATTSKRKDDAGNVKELTEWHRVTAWSKTAENCGKYLTKGSGVCVEGHLQTRKYQKNGQDHYATEIVAENVQFLGKKTGEQVNLDGKPQAYEDLDLSNLPF